MKRNLVTNDDGLTVYDRDVTICESHTGWFRILSWQCYELSHYFVKAVLQKMSSCCNVILTILWHHAVYTTKKHENHQTQQPGVHRWQQPSHVLYIGLHIKNADNNHTIRRYYIKYSTLTSYSTEMTDRSRWPIGNTADLQSAMPRFDNRPRRMLFTGESQ